MLPSFLSPRPTCFPRIVMLYGLNIKTFSIKCRYSLFIVYQNSVFPFEVSGSSSFKSCVCFEENKVVRLG